MQPGPIADSSHAQALVDRTSAQRSLTEAESFALPVDTPPHRDYVTPQVERPGNAEDRQQTRLRLAAMNDDPALGGIAAAADMTDDYLDVMAELGRDPVAEFRAEHHERQAREAAHALDCARREANYQADIAQRKQAARTPTSGRPGGHRRRPRPWRGSVVDSVPAQSRSPARPSRFEVTGEDNARPSSAPSRG